MIKLTQILADASNIRDANYRKLAQNFYSKLIQVINKKSRSIQILSKLGKIWIHGKYINKDYADLIIIFTDHSRYDGEFYELLSSQRSVYKAQYGITIKVSEHSIDSMIKNADTSKLYSDTMYAKNTIIHEFIHYLDQKRKKDQTFTRTSAKHSKDYYNDPHEFNAWYQADIDEFMDEFDYYPHIRMKIKKMSFKEFRQYMENQQLTSDFVKNLNRKYKRKLDKRLYQLYRDIQHKLQ